MRAKLFILFEPPIALAVAEAMDMTIQNADLVTVAILESRFEKADAKQAARFGEVEARIVALESNMNARFQVLEERMKRRDLQLILCTAAVVVGNDHLDAIGAFIANAFRALLA